MIKLLRIDDRLVHGQVAVSWTNYLDADTILVANDSLLTNPTMQTAFKLAKPPQAILSMKSIEGAKAVLHNPKHAARKIFVITGSAKDALALCNDVKEIKKVNVGGIRQAEGKTRVLPQVFLGKEDYECLNALVDLGVEVELQTLPTEHKTKYEKTN